MHVLVTGGAGFIGSHLVNGLLEAGFRVRVLDNLAYGQRDWIPPHVEFIKGDICDLATCTAAAQGIDAIFHCAAMSRAAPSLDDINSCTQTNIVGTQNILIAARDAKVRKIIYSGSSTYYGSQPIPHREYHTPSEFLNFYSLSKHVGEQYCLLFDAVFDLPCVILRYFNVYGPRQPRNGAYALVMGIFLQRWACDEALEIHGDGSQRRDFIHVHDVVKANIAALDKPVRHAIFNIGSGSSISVKELADTISSKQMHCPRRAGDAQETLADITLARDILGWEPRISVQEGLTALMLRSTRPQI